MIKYNSLQPETDLSAILAKLRVKRHRTQAGVARDMKTSTASVSRFETSGAHSPTLATLRRHADALGYDFDIVFHDSQIEMEIK